jgi:hypothetical protein
MCKYNKMERLLHALRGAGSVAESRGGGERGQLSDVKPNSISDFV